MQVAVVSFGAASILYTLTLVHFKPFAKIMLIILSFLRIFPLWTLNFRSLQYLQCWRKERETGEDSSSISFHGNVLPILLYHGSYLALHVRITAWLAGLLN